MNQAGHDPEALARMREAVRHDPGRMTMQVAREFGVAEAEVVRALPDGRAVELNASRWQELIRALGECGEVHVIVSNGATTIEAVGQFGGFSLTGPFFNVQSDSLDMHIRWRRLASIFAVEKPSHTDGTRTLSIQFYDTSGDAALKVFLVFAGKPSEKRLALFASLKERFAKAQSLDARE